MSVPVGKGLKNEQLTIQNGIVTVTPKTKDTKVKPKFNKHKKPVDESSSGPFIKFLGVYDKYNVDGWEQGNHCHIIGDNMISVAKSGNAIHLIVNSITLVSGVIHSEKFIGELYYSYGENDFKIVIASSTEDGCDGMLIEFGLRFCKFNAIKRELKSVSRAPANAPVSPTKKPIRFTIADEVTQDGQYRITTDSEDTKAVQFMYEGKLYGMKPGDNEIIIGFGDSTIKVPIKAKINRNYILTPNVFNGIKKAFEESDDVGSHKPILRCISNVSYMIDQLFPE